MPEGSHGPVAERRFSPDDYSPLVNMSYAMDGRRCQPGTYTMLTRNGQLWMSDTTAETTEQATKGNNP